MLGIQTLHYLSRVSVLALKISRYIVHCIYYKLNILPARVVWNWNSHLLYCCFLMFFFSSHSALWKSACDFVPSHSNCSSSCGWDVSLLSYQTDKAKVNWNTNFWQEKLFFRLSILYYKLNQVGYLTNTFHFAVGLFSYRPQMSNCGKKKKWLLSCSWVSLMCHHILSLSVIYYWLDRLTNKESNCFILQGSKMLFMVI